MEHYYINQWHKERLKGLIEDDSMRYGDAERLCLFYIIAGNESLYKRCRALYDFEEHCIIDCIKERMEDFSSGLLSLIKLGFNLYNGYRGNDMTPLDLFWNLDDVNRQLAENAIHLRFNSHV